MTPPWPGKLLSLAQLASPKTCKPFDMGFDPVAGQRDCLGLPPRSPTATNFAPGTYAGDISLVNWPQNDYWLGNLFDVPPSRGGAAHRARPSS